MSVAIVLQKSENLELLLGWATLIARARHEDLYVLYVAQSPGEADGKWLQPSDVASDSPLAAAIQRTAGSHFAWLKPAEDSDEEDASEAAAEAPRNIFVQQLQDANLSENILSQVAALGIGLLILPRHHAVRSTSPEFELQRRLFRDATCEAMQVRLGEKRAEECRSILIPAGGGQHSTIALQLGAQLAEASDGHVTALYVEPNVDEVADQVGQTIVRRVVTRALGPDHERVKTKVMLSNEVIQGIERERDQGYDLLLAGVRYHGVVHRFLFPSISERLMTASQGPAVAVMRPAIPLASRVIRWGERTLKHGVPQLGRSRRVALVERVQMSSRWDFDFVALTCLSTLIATLGLVLNSGAVVIGAMLVAPLMTPLLGAGLSLVQGNAVLLRNAVNAVFRGFLLALLIGMLVGLATPGLELTPEMKARTSPGVFDLLVAFTSGVAAAYAIGRPNLLSALPGVAIAAALVPPIATCGLCFVVGRVDLGIGAGLLFLTNIIAIVLGAACSLFAVGIRGTHAHGTFANWAWRVAFALVLLIVGLGVYEALPKADLPHDVYATLEQRLLESDADMQSVSVDKYRQPIQVDMTIRIPRAPEPGFAREILGILERHFGPNVQLDLHTELVTRVRS